MSADDGGGLDEAEMSAPCRPASGGERPEATAGGIKSGTVSPSLADGELLS